MADEQSDDYYEAILNQPWDPVSYFEDEAESNAQNGVNELSRSQSRNLSELFDDLNIRSLENDIKRLSIRKQQSEDIPDSVFENAKGSMDDSEEPSGSIERFISYEDREDHLKAVDNTDVINKKSIDGDMKRLAHFKQNSLELTNQHESSLQGGLIGFQFSQIGNSTTEDQTYLEELIRVLPNVVESEPIFPVSNSNGQDLMEASFQNSNLNELIDFDISHLLPEPVSENTDGELVLKVNDNDLEGLSDLRFNTISNTAFADDRTGIQSSNQAQHYVNKTFDFIESESSSSRGSSDSLKQIIGQAEAIVQDSTEISESTEHHESFKDMQEDEKTLHLSPDRDLSHNENAINQSATYEPNFEQIKNDNVATDDLLVDFGFENNRQSQSGASISLLHNDLLSSSPKSDLCDPKSDLVSIEGRDTTQDASVMVTAPSNKKKERKTKAVKSKYLVDIVKCENSDSDTDFDQDNLSDSLSTDLQQELSGPDVIIDKEISTDFSYSDNRDETLQAGEENQFSPKEDMPTSEEVTLSEEAVRISERLVDDILNEDLRTVQNLEPAAVDLVFPEEVQDTENIIVDSNARVNSGVHVDACATTELPSNISDEILPVDSSTSGEATIDDITTESLPVRTSTRLGSTSDSEELEEFINQQLSDNIAGASATMAQEPAGTSPLVPVNEEIQLGWYAPMWVPDKDARICMNCGLKFTVVKRRHHCRACGKVLCSNCCNMKADLAYLSYKTSRVCQACFEILSTAQSLSPLPLMSGSRDVPGRGHTISLNDSEPGCSSLPLDSPPQYMPDSPPEYSVLPGNAAQNGPPNPPSYFASVRGTGFRSRTESDRSAVIMFNSSQTDLPPVLRIENEVVKIINNPNLSGLFEQMKDTSKEPVAFLVNKNLVVKVRIVPLECCANKDFWCFSSDGMGASNQEEVVFVVECKNDDQRLMKCVFQQFNLIFERAKLGEPLSDFGYLPIDEYMQINRRTVGMILFKPNVQCTNNLLVPCHPYLFGLWIQQPEVPWAKNLPLRLLIRLGAEFKSYPYPFYNLEDREPVFHVVGRTIIALLADFRSFQYTVPKISGLLVSVTKKDTIIKLPQTRYDEVLKVLNTTEESVMAFGGNFHRKADSHLVCVETDGTHATQTISCRTSSKKLTGCSFVVFSAALKSSTNNLQAKASIVEDGIMVQVTSDTMKKIRTAMKEMQDLIIPASEGSNEAHKLKIIWGSSDDSTPRITSPIDGSSFDGLTNMRIRHSYDFTVSTSPAKIHWQEVYFLPSDADTVGRLSAQELSQMTSSVAKACMNALSPHLSSLVALEMTKIGLRMILDADVVEYRIGANKEQLPQELTGDLDDKLIPVIHGVMKTVSHRRVSAELIFQITRIV